ncbi:XRE family transcriptional regulator [Pseudomonas sp. ABC1]|uniref:helix-turn-helix domain-containing protein n=1 Tax=Pseudomonas sp. ABC1 TaxID=2748080 RepID=UPI0015C38F39|nr:helix-turn-helix transcriptional regulator [Pseudomonas sp. ABC1]QLF91743.1 XRE family transcriptional regulator [Pseudomonas sp. ABC1]
MRKHKSLLPDSTLSLLAQLGINIDQARKRRRLSVDTICSRAGITAQTYRRLSKGEPGIGIGIMAAVLSAMNLEDDLALIASPSSDEVGIAMERAHQPKRIREEASDELDTDF